MLNKGLIIIKTNSKLSFVTFLHGKCLPIFDLEPSIYLLKEILIDLATPRRSQWRRSVNFTNIPSRLHRGTRNESRNQWRAKTSVEVARRRPVVPRGSQLYTNYDCNVFASIATKYI